MFLTRWWRRRRAQKTCFHHDWRTGESWIRVECHLDGGRRAFVCLRCDWLSIQ